MCAEASLDGGAWSVRVRPSDDPIIRINDHQLHGIARRPGAHHLRGQPINLAERGRHGVMLADERGLPAALSS